MLKNEFEPINRTAVMTSGGKYVNKFDVLTRSKKFKCYLQNEPLSILAAVKHWTLSSNNEDIITMKEKFNDEEYGQMISRSCKYIGCGISKIKLIVTFNWKFFIDIILSKFSKLKMNLNIYFFAVISLLSLSVFGANSCDSSPQKKDTKKPLNEATANHPGGYRDKPKK
uniref:SCP domain-containing protein n=1 Tax=Strongyloides venezuelensis TaxID=75913 RepID=A0A0K0F1U2_STRVS